ncbi:aspartyl-tRNA synthetase [Pancytospora philotis]|nr:aspartyl-tRNA synthetase [Pancytospora philotis]
MDTKLNEMTLTERTLVADLDESFDEKRVRVRGFVSTVRCMRKFAFIVLREGIDTLQLIYELPKEGLGEDAVNPRTLNLESYVEVVGRVRKVATPVGACSKSSIELDIEELALISASVAPLPFSLKDASATAEEREKNPSICNVSYSLRLDNRFLDLRMAQTQAIFRVVSGFRGAFLEYALENGFSEISTTKIIQSGSEGGSNLFSMDYFGKTAYLAQSPQLYKQMAIAGGMRRVFEIGHVYRAEQSNINRYLSEFVGVDFEMEIDRDYREAVRFVYSAIVHVLDAVKRRYAREIEIIRGYRPFADLVYEAEPVVITHHDAVDLLRARGVAVGYEDDFSREAEKILGEIVKEKHGVDLFVVVEYPEMQRAFYTYVDKSTGKSHSYDFIMRGEEILSGARRITAYEDLEAAVVKRGLNPTSIQFYLDCFKYGVPPHAGCGIGLERLLKSYFSFDDIRYFTLYPRDPNRIYP